MNTEEPQIRPDFYLVVIPHDMDWWNLPPEHREVIKGIETVWLFDKNLHVHCCEVTPSYELWPIETRVVFKEDFDQDSNESLRDLIEEDIRHWSQDEVEYRHVSNVKSLMAREGIAQYSLGDFTKGVSYDDEPYEEQRDSALEYCMGNSMV